MINFGETGKYILDIGLRLRITELRITELIKG